MPLLSPSLILFLFSSLGFASTLTFDFSDLTKFDSSSTAVWNLVSKKLHVPFIVDRTDTTVNVTETEDDMMPIGTGSHGEFSPNTYAQFDINGLSTPNLITLDSSIVYEFTQFNLASGYTLKGQGTSPLRIRVQGDATVSGTIDLKGTSGEAASSDVNSTPSGGRSFCGGGAGGSGGNTSITASDGTSADSNDSGKGRKGAPSSTVGKHSGSGGGGGFEVAPFAAVAGQTEAGGGGAGGAAGAGYSDEFLSTFVGGSGGGGGASYTLGASNGAGAGGGGGGGALQIFVGGNFRVETGGQILATGGNGGSTTVGVLAGAGGGAGQEVRLKFL